MDQQITLQLTQNQQNLFNLFKKFQQQTQLKTVIRVAGGWVRDKVLGKESKDIDIALDDMMGQQFVSKLKSWTENGQNKEITMSGIGVIKSNPENSKNLETATARVNGFSIDFVNLRSEKYTQTSRIPIIEIGTPLEDALRRDFTINSLFYNINTQLVEDWTKSGLKDLKGQPKLLRTPLDPSVTFKDDPLRIMRCLRFKARFECKVDEEIYKAIQQPDILEALSKKVSRERIGNQLEGLLKAKFFLVGLEDIKDYGLWNIVWKVPEQSQFSKNAETLKSIPNFSFAVTVQFTNSLKNQWKTKTQLISQAPEKQSPEEVVKQLKQKKQKEQVPKIKQKIQYSENELQFLLLISSLCYVYKNQNVKVGKVKSTLVQYMIKDQLKYPAKVAKFGHHFVQTVEKLRQLKSLDNIYPIIRWLRFAQQKWELAIHFLHAVNQIEKTQSILNLFQFRQWVFEKKLDNCYLVQPPVSGDIILKRGIKGPAISKVLQNVAIWKITNPYKNAEQFLEELQKNVQFFMAAQTYH